MTPKMLNALAKATHTIHKERGWWDGKKPGIELLFRAAKLLLVHSEISEAAEGLRKGGMSDKIPSFSNFEEEIADALMVAYSTLQAR